ncbi:MAG: hypothetical protein ACT4NP_08635 [Pseudonocardiales bacterium]
MPGHPDDDLALVTGHGVAVFFQPAVDAARSGHPVNTAPNTGRRWALSPVDSCRHLLAEGGQRSDRDAVDGLRAALPCAVDTSPHPPPARTPLPVSGARPAPRVPGRLASSSR